MRLASAAAASEPLPSVEIPEFAVRSQRAAFRNSPSGVYCVGEGKLKTRQRTILVVDDDANDRFFIVRALHSLDTTCTVHALSSGDEAIAYLSGSGKYRNRKRFQFPGYIITDLKMPNGDGFDVLNFLKHNPVLSVVPVLMLSGSGDDDDIRRAYALGASAYMVKPQKPEELRRRLQLLYAFFSECEVPEVNEAGEQLETQSQDKLGHRFSTPPINRGCSKG